MKIAVFGAGGVGGHIAARLALSGVKVGVVARGNHLRAMQSDGLRLQIEDDTHTSEVRAVENPADLGGQDLVIVSLKGPSLPAAISQIVPLVDEQTRVAFVMNGLPWWFADGLPVVMTTELRRSLDPAGNFGSLVPLDRTIWGVITSGGAIAAPGVIRSTTPNVNTVIFGYPDDREDDFIRDIAAMFKGAGYDASISKNIRKSIWQKLLLNASQAMVATVTNRNHLQVTTDAETRGLTMAVMREVLAIGEAIGLPLDADPMSMTDPKRYGTHVPSFLQDLRAGRPLELDSTILAARDLARAKDIPAPSLTAVAAIVAALSADQSGLVRPSAGCGTGC